MAEYRIICVVRGSNGHPQALGYSEFGNEVIYDDRWTLLEAWQAIKDGHRLYTVSPSTGEQTDLELCADDIGITFGQGADSSLDQLPECG
jgi:hypothetical protein